MIYFQNLDGSAEKQKLFDFHIFVTVRVISSAKFFEENY